MSVPSTASAALRMNWSGTVERTTDNLTEDRAPANRKVESNGLTVRSVYGAHSENDECRKLAEDPNLVQMAMQLVGDAVHVFQFKLNPKRALVGAGWPWHQDYTYFHKEDGMPMPRCVNAVLFLDEITEFNGPVIVVPGSHKRFFGLTPGEGRTAADDAAGAWDPSPANAGARYPVSQSDLQSLIRSNCIEAPKGPARSVLFFHVNTLHASQPNISPFDRSLALVTYNSSSNTPRNGRRESFVASSDSTPILPLSWLPEAHLPIDLIA